MSACFHVNCSSNGVCAQSAQTSSRVLCICNRGYVDSYCSKLLQPCEPNFASYEAMRWLLMLLGFSLAAITAARICVIVHSKLESGGQPSSVMRRPWSKSLLANPQLQTLFSSFCGCCLIGGAWVDFYGAEHIRNFGSAYTGAQIYFSTIFAFGAAASAMMRFFMLTFAQFHPSTRPMMQAFLIVSAVCGVIYIAGVAMLSYPSHFGTGSTMMLIAGFFWAAVLFVGIGLYAHRILRPPTDPGVLRAQSAEEQSARANLLRVIRAVQACFGVTISLVIFFTVLPFPDSLALSFGWLLAYYVSVALVGIGYGVAMLLVMGRRSGNNNARTDTKSTQLISPTIRSIQVQGRARESDVPV